MRKLSLADLLLVAVIWAAGDVALAQTAVLPANGYSPAPISSGPSRPWGVLSRIVPDDKSVEDAAEDRAERTLRQIENQTGERMSDDFEDGFEQAYIDLGMGRSGIVPAVPPKKYWKAYYRTAEGRVYAYDWFSGYEAGAELGRVDGMTEFRAIPSSFDYDYHCSECNRCQTCQQQPQEFMYPQTPAPGIPPEIAPPPPAPAATTFVPAESPRFIENRPVQPTPGFAAPPRNYTGLFAPPVPAPPAEIDPPSNGFAPPSAASTPISGAQQLPALGAGHTSFGR